MQPVTNNYNANATTSQNQNASKPTEHFSPDKLTMLYKEAISNITTSKMVNEQIVMFINELKKTDITHIFLVKDFCINLLETAFNPNSKNSKIVINNDLTNREFNAVFTKINSYGNLEIQEKKLLVVKIINKDDYRLFKLDFNKIRDLFSHVKIQYKSFKDVDNSKNACDMMNQLVTCNELTLNGPVNLAEIINLKSTTKLHLHNCTFPSSNSTFTNEVLQHLAITYKKYDKDLKKFISVVNIVYPKLQTVELISPSAKEIHKNIRKAISRDFLDKFTYNHSPLVEATAKKVKVEKFPETRDETYSSFLAENGMLYITDSTKNNFSDLEVVDLEKVDLDDWQ